MITEAQKRQYQEQGFFILDHAISDQHLALLRDEAEMFLSKIHHEMDEKGTDSINGQIRNNRYFIANRYKESARLSEFIFSDLMADVCRATLGPDAFLFYEQYVIKGAEKGMKFSWHQDSGYVKAPHKPYVSCWCALDIMSEANGTVYMLPYDRAGTKTRIEHERQGLDLVGYHGDDPGVPVICPAGSVAVFSSVCFHRSGSNTTDKMRRVYLTQYSAAPIVRPDGAASALVEPFLKNGEKIK